MALADTAKLVASLELQDKFSANAAKFDRTVLGMERSTARLDKFGYTIGRGIGAATHNIALLGAAGAGVLIASVTSGLQTLQKLESVTAQTNAVLESTQAVAGQTAESIRNLAEKYESLNATMDDKVIQSGENVLLTFTNIRKEAFEPALAAALNMNQALGGGEEGLQGTIIQLGKALQDPIKGITALRRVGVNFTDQQKGQIKELVKANDLFGAQKIILAELSTEFGGSFAKAGDTAAGKFAKLRDAVEDAQASLATALLPVMERVSDRLTTFLSDPKTTTAIESFGEGLADGFDKVVLLAGKVPWETIGSSLQLAGQGAKAVLDAFVSLPDWIQTAVLTGWGLNKLTGGALTSLFGQGISFIFERGASPANPLWVQSVTGGVGGPGIPGLPLVAGGSALAVALTVGTIAAIGTAFVASQLVRQDPFAHEGDVITPGRGFGRFDDHGLRDDLVNNTGAVKDNTAAQINLHDDLKLPGAPGRGPGPTPKPLPLDDAALIAALEKTSEFGKAGVGTTIEHGITTGTDPFGEEALALFRRAEFPQQGRTLGEIQRHIIAAEEVQKEYLESGDINSVKRTQAVIDGLHALLGTTDKTLPDMVEAARVQAQKTEEFKQVLATLPGPVRELARKDFSSVVNVSTVVNVTNSATQITQSVRRLLTANATRLTDAGVGL